MDTFQKIIKALAIALAVFIIFCIVSVILLVVSTILKISFVFDLVTIEEGEVKSYTESYNIEEVQNLEIISTVANVEIIYSDVLQVVAEDVTDKFKVELKDGNLKIEEKMKTNISFGSEIKPEIKVYIPEGFKFSVANVSLGVSEYKIDSLIADEINLTIGVGDAEIDYIEAIEKIKIDTGVGKLYIKDSKLSELELNAGVGNYDITALLTGNCKLDCGIGNGILTLKDFNEETTCIKMDKGLGNIRVDGKEYNEGQIFGTGSEIIDINGGVGNITLNLQ